MPLKQKARHSRRMNYSKLKLVALAIKQQDREIKIHKLRFETEEEVRKRYTFSTA